MKNPTWRLNRPSWQWQPTTTAHDPSPPITLENAPVATGRSWMMPLVGVGMWLVMMLI